MSRRNDAPTSRIPLRLLGAGLVAAVAVVLLARAFWPEKETVPRRRGRAELYADVERVVSPAKIKIDDKKKDYEVLVYAGIRPPYRGEPFYEQALQRNRALVDGRRIRLRFGKTNRDRKGRLFAYVFVGDVFVNETLVREGLAYVRLTPGARRFADRLLEAQRDARRHRRGLWSLQPPPRATVYHADRKHGNFHRPTCEDAAKIKPERLVTFQRRDQAFEQGFAPCSKCKP